MRRLVLGAFVCLTLPITCALVVTDWAARSWLPAYSVTVGVTHFWITGFVYLDARNLRYFNASTRNRLVYFAAPLAIFIAMDALAVSGLRARHRALDTVVFQLVMVANFLHVSRQSFGVLQLFKEARGGPFPEALRTVESGFFLGLAVLQAETLLLGGHYVAGDVGVRVTSALVSGLCAIAAVLHVAALRAAPRRREAWAPLCYFLAQATAGALAVWQIELYPVALAMHYVEYHVAMMPRIFAVPAEAGSRADRLRVWLVPSRGVLFALLAAVAWGFWWLQRTRLYQNPNLVLDSPLLAVAVHALDGLILAHFFVDTFVWRLGKPHYHATLRPLYRGGAGA